MGDVRTILAVPTIFSPMVAWCRGSIAMSLEHQRCYVPTGVTYKVASLLYLLILFAIEVKMIISE